MILSSVPSDTISDPIIDQDPRAAITAQRAKCLYQVLRCQRVCRVWRSAIQNDINLQRLLFLVPSTHYRRSWIVDDTPSQYPDRSDRRPILNPMIQHHLRRAELTFAPLHNFAADESKPVRHQAYLKIERVEFAKWTHMTLPLPSSGQMTTDDETYSSSHVLPSWCRMQLSIPPVREVTCIPWDWKEWGSEPRSVFIKGRIRDENGITAGLIMAEAGGLFNEYPTLNAINVYTTL